jgi:hypothetical protein
MERRLFLTRSLQLVISVPFATSLLEGCGKSSSNGDSGATAQTGGNCALYGTTTYIQVVHTPNHTLTIPESDVTAGVAKTYTLENNGSGHTHTVTLTAADFTNLRNNAGVMETSTLTAGHTHTVTVNCAASSSGGGGYNAGL